MQDNFPILDPQSAIAKQAADLHATWIKRRAAVATVEAEHAEALAAKQAAKDALDKALTEAAVAGKPARSEAALVAKLAEAEARAQEPWEARLTAARVAVTHAHGDYAAHVDATLDELLDELRPDAESAVTLIDAAVQELRAALAGWHRVAQRAGALLRHALLIDGQAIPRLTLPLSASDLEAIDGGALPLPLPREDRLAYRREVLAQGEQPQTAMAARL